MDLWSGRLRDACGRFAPVSLRALERGAELAEAHAKALAPVVTGRLRASIEGSVEGTGTGRSVTGSSVFVSADRRYAPIEFGSRRGHVAQRFLERGMFAALDEMEDELGDELEGLFAGTAGHIGPRFSGRRR